MSTIVKILIAVLVVIAIIACIALVAVWLLNRGGDQAVEDPLAGTHWQVRSYYNAAETGGMASPLSGVQLTAEFVGASETEDAVVGGSAGCNTYNAGYTVDGDSLSIGLPAVTMMFCGEPEGTMDQETAYLAALESASSFKLESDQLHILNDKDQVVVDFVPFTALPEATEPTEGDAWDRIQAAGKMVAGTAADYPPFESYVGPGQIDGFDIALMDEIGRRLGVAVEYRDMAFDGLGPALNQGQIDVAVAAISRTPEREALVDFSNVYLVSEDGALAHVDSDIVLTTVDDLTQYKVGVQRGSVYQEWVQIVLINEGRMSPDNLFAYEKAEDAVRDLQQNRVELVILDAQAAQAFADKGGVQLVGKGLNAQNYAIALPKGEDALKTKMDEVITSLYNDGTIAGLVQKYLGLPQVLPTPTAAATSTPAPPPDCLDGLTLVKELTTEGDMAPGQAFTKGWQVQNTGSCTWDTGYRLVFVSGHRMSGGPVAVDRQVGPGETYDLLLNLVAPRRQGTYQGVWQMENGAGTAFGERLRVAINVVAGPTATPVPTQTPVPGIIFNVDRSEIKEGECVTFYWKVDNVDQVYFYREGQNWPDHGVTGEETRVECPPVTTTYYLRVALRNGSVEVRQITIVVEPSADVPDITRFTVDPPGQITLGQCVNIRWQVEGSVDQTKLTVNDELLWELAPSAGTLQHCPDVAGTAVYAIEATGPGGTARQQHHTNVVDVATATPVPTAPPEAPVIHTFSLTPNQVETGECMNITWGVGGGATYSRILRNGVLLIDDAGYNGQHQDCPDQAGSYTYRLEASNPAGDVVFDERVGTVADAAPDNPLAGTEWQVTAIHDAKVGGIGVVAPGITVTMAFDASGNVNGTSGCNTYSARYTVDGTLLAITPPTGSSMMCDDETMAVESDFLATLPLAGAFSLEAGELYILDASNEVLMESVTIP